VEGNAGVEDEEGEEQQQDDEEAEDGVDAEGAAYGDTNEECDKEVEIKNAPAMAANVGDTEDSYRDGYNDFEEVAEESLEDAQDAKKSAKSLK